METGPPEKGKSPERARRKATGLRLKAMAAGLPGEVRDERHIKEQNQN